MVSQPIKIASGSAINLIVEYPEQSNCSVVNDSNGPVFIITSEYEGSWKNPTSCKIDKSNTTVSYFSGEELLYEESVADIKYSHAKLAAIQEYKKTRSIRNTPGNRKARRKARAERRSKGYV